MQRAADGRPDGVRVGSEVPRVYTPPLRRLTPRSSLGFACIEFAEQVLGIELLPWQRWLLVHALELLPDGMPRFRTVVLLVARQNGKSTLLQILALFMLYVRGVSLVIGTAQNLDIAEEVWQGAVDIAEDVPDLASLISRVVKVNGKKSLELSAGERYKVQAANRRGGRGLSGDLVMLDELREHQTWHAWGAVTKTTLARPLAQVWAVSNAGDAASVVLRFLRAAAHEALGDPDGLATRTAGDETAQPPDEVETEDEDSLGLFEWSATPGTPVWDRDGWAQANPSLGHTITERSIAAAARTDPEWVFRTEVLCQWADHLLEDIFPDGSWGASRDARSRTNDRAARGFAIDVSPSRTRAAIAVAGVREDGRTHVEVVQTGSGTRWVAKRVRALVDKWGGELALDPASPAGALIPDLTEQGIEPRNVTGGELGRAFGFMVDQVAGDQIRHLGQPELDDAVAGAVAKDIGDGAKRPSRKESQVDISPLVAAIEAVWIVAGAPPQYDVLDSAW